MLSVQDDKVHWQDVGYYAGYYYVMGMLRCLGCASLEAISVNQ